MVQEPHWCPGPFEEVPVGRSGRVGECVQGTGGRDLFLEIRNTETTVKTGTLVPDTSSFRKVLRSLRFFATTSDRRTTLYV